MNRQVRVSIVRLSVAAALSLWLTNTSIAVAQSSQPNDPVAVITAFKAAISAWYDSWDGKKPILSMGHML